MANMFFKSFGLRGGYYVSLKKVRRRGSNVRYKFQRGVKPCSKAAGHYFFSVNIFDEEIVNILK